MQPILENVIIEIQDSTPSVGTVVGIGKSIEDTCGFRVGDTIFTTEFGGVKFHHESKTYLWLTVREVLGICPPTLIVNHSSYMEALQHEFEMEIRRAMDSELAIIE